MKERKFEGIAMSVWELNILTTEESTLDVDVTGNYVNCIYERDYSAVGAIIIIIIPAKFPAIRI